MIALCQSLRTVLEARNLPEELKNSLAVMVFNLYFDLDEPQIDPRYSTALLKLISEGGLYRKRTDSDYRTPLITAFEREKMEYIIKQDEERLSKLEAAVYGRPFDVKL